MPTNINFLRQRKKNLTALQVTDKRYATWLGYLFGLLMVAYVFLLAFNYFFQTRIASIMDRQDQAERTITQQQTQEFEYLVLVEKLNVIEDILKNKADKREAIAYFTQLFATEETELKEIQFMGEGVLEFQVISSDVFTFDDTLNKLFSQEMSTRFQSVAVGNLSRGRDGTYSVRVSVFLKNPSANTAAARSSGVDEREEL